MFSYFDSIASSLQKVSWQIALLICFSMIVACSGCGREGSASTAALGIDPQLLTQHGQIHFIEDVALGRQLSSEKGKPCLLFFTAEWCTYCRQMEETAFVDSVVGKLSENFVCVLVDADQNPQVCQEYSVTGYPTIQFVSADGRALNRLVGRQSAPALATGMQAAMKRFAWLSEPDIQVR